MSYKSDLQNNNTDLQGILETINTMTDKPQVITSTTEIEEGSASSYPENSLYIVYEEA